MATETAELTAEEQAAAEEIAARGRQSQADAGDRPGSGSMVDFVVGSGTAPCETCGVDVEGATVLVQPDGQQAALPIICARCGADEDDLAMSSVGPGGSRRRPRTIEDWLESIGVNTAKHGHATLDNFDPSDSPAALAAARRFVHEVSMSERHQRVRGLYLVGDPDPAREGHTGHGTGKSHIAVSVIRAIRLARPDLRIVYDAADRLVTKVQDSYSHGTTDGLIDLRAMADVYVLDDLGREKPTADALRVLCTILDEREGKPTAITSNALPHELGARHGDTATWARVETRLGDHVYQFLAVRGPDRRFQSEDA